MPTAGRPPKLPGSTGVCAKNAYFPLCPQGGSARGDRQHAIEAPLTEAADQNGIVLANLPAGPTERRIAFAVALALLGIAAAVAPFASVQLPRSDAWIPITNTYIFIADLVTWVLLISQFEIVRWHALLVVASGYLFTAMMAVPLLLTFPGAFTQTGLLGAGLQTNGWISAFWVSGYPLATIGYALLKNREPGALVAHGSTRIGLWPRSTTAGIWLRAQSG